MTASPSPSSATPRAARPARPVRPDATPRPANDLIDETHRQIEEVLKQMELLQRLLARNAVPAQIAELAATTCRYFNGPARAHHEAEETQVFPALLAGHDAAVRAAVQRLQQDHNWIEEDWLELEPHLQAVAQGHGPAHAAFLRPALAEFTALYREHLAVEEALLHG